MTSRLSLLAVLIGGLVVCGCGGNAHIGELQCANCVTDTRLAADTSDACRSGDCGCPDAPPPSCVDAMTALRCVDGDKAPTTVSCPNGCDAASGLCRLCEPTSRRCDGERVARCGDDGMSWQHVESCSASCHAGECRTCVPGDARCLGTDSQRCNDGGTAWVNDEACASGCLGVDAELLLKRANRLSVGLGISCQISAGGALRCWGLQASGLLGKSTDSPEKPLLMGSGEVKWKAVRSDGQHACAIRDDGALFCWGNNSAGQLGLNHTQQQTTPTRVGIGLWRMVAVVGARTCGIMNDGSLWCWGTRNNFREFFGGASKNDLVPTRVGSGADRFSWLTLHGDTLCTVRSLGLGPAGEIHCMGHLVWLKRALVATSFPATSAVPVKVTSGARWLSVSFGDAGFCGIQCDGSLWCAKPSIAQEAAQIEVLPEKVGDGPWTNVFSKGTVTCAVKQEGSLWCWGHGPLGDGNFQSFDQPQRILGAFDEPLDAVVGRTRAHHFCASGASDRVWCWGESLLGQLGVPDGRRRKLPERIGTWSDWTWAAVGNEYSCGRRSNGQLYCWGKILAYGSPEPNQVQSSPLLISSTSPETFHIGIWGTIGLLDDQTLWAWSPNPPYAANWLALGRKETDPWLDVEMGSSLTICGIDEKQHLYCGGGIAPGGVYGPPGPLNDGRQWRNVSVGDRNACAIDAADQSLWCWGENFSGSLFPTATHGAKVTLPTRASANAWSSIATLGRYRCGLQSDRRLWCWGHAPMVDVNLEDVVLSQPTRIGSDTWLTLGNKLPNCGIKDTDRSLWCWQITDDSTPGQHPPPQQIDPESGRQWQMVAGAGRSFCGISTEGGLFCWGDNGYGQLGIGYAYQLATPHEVDFTP